MKEIIFTVKESEEGGCIASARKHIKFEIDSFCDLLIFPQVIDTKASNHCEKIKISSKII